MVKKLRMADRIRSREKGAYRGVITFGKNRIQVPYVDALTGEIRYRSEFEEVHDELENIVPIGAYQFAFNKLFNIGLDENSTLRVGDLNDEAPQGMRIGVPRARYKSIHYNAETSITNPSVPVNSGLNIPGMNFCFGFMIGDGGAREDNKTAISPDYKSRHLNRAIPFRMLDDMTGIPAGRYFGKAITSSPGTNRDIVSFYVKTFDQDPAPPRIVHAWVTDAGEEFSPVDESVFASTSSTPIESYVEINLSVSADDGREFFTTTGATPRINEFGLVTGWFNAEENDYESIRIFTKFSRSSISLSDGDRIEAIYRLYAR